MSQIKTKDLPETVTLEDDDMAHVVGGKMPRGKNRYVANGHYADNGLAVPNPYYRPDIMQSGGENDHDFGEGCVDDPSIPCPGE